MLRNLSRFRKLGGDCSRGCKRLIGAVAHNAVNYFRRLGIEVGMRPGVLNRLRSGSVVPVYDRRHFCAAISKCSCGIAHIHHRTRGQAWSSWPRSGRTSPVPSTSSRRVTRQPGCEVERIAGEPAEWNWQSLWAAVPASLMRRIASSW